MKMLNPYQLAGWLLSFGCVASSAWAIGPNPGGPPDSKPRTPGDLPPESCQRFDEAEELVLINLRPISSEQGLTQQANPTLLFYVPYVAATGEFIVFYQGDTSEPLYRAQVALPNAAGLVGLTIPSEIPMLQYHSWYFRVNCTTVNGGDGRETIGGYLYRVDNEAADIGTAYYDEIAETAQQLADQNPQAWVELLAEIDAIDDAHADGDIDFVDLVDYHQAPFLGSVTIIEETASN